MFYPVRPRPDDGGDDPMGVGLQYFLGLFLVAVFIVATMMLFSR